MPDEFFVPEEDEVPAPNPVDPIYARQATLGLADPIPTVMIVGTGGVGCWVALALTLGGVEQLTLFDADSLSTHNLNRFPLPEASVGEMKSVALAHWLETLRPKVLISARGEFDSNIHEVEANWLVCCTDSLKSRRMCHAYAEKGGMKYLEVGADGERWTLSPAPPEFSTSNEEQAGYATVPVHVGPCMMAGAAAAYYVLHDSLPVFSHSAGWVRGPIIRSMPNLGGIKFESMSEMSFDDCLDCPICGVKVQADVITLTRHYRDDTTRLKGVVPPLEESAAWARHQLEQWNAVEPEADEMGNAILDDEVEAIEAMETAEAIEEAENGQA